MLATVWLLGGVSRENLLTITDVHVTKLADYHIAIATKAQLSKSYQCPILPQISAWPKARMSLISIQ